MIGFLIGVAAGGMLISGLWWLLVVVLVIWAAIHIVSFIGSILTLLFYGFLIFVGIYFLMFIIGLIIGKEDSNVYKMTADDSVVTINATDNDNLDKDYEEYTDTVSEEWTYEHQGSKDIGLQNNHIVTLHV